MRGLPFSLVCAHLQTETQGLRDQVVLNLDNMVDSHWSGRSTGWKLLGKKKKQSWENNLLLLETLLFSIIIFLLGRITNDSQKLTVVSTCSGILLIGLLAKIYSTSYYHGQRLKFFRLLPVFKPRYITNMLPTRFKYYKNQLVNLNVYSANTCETIP